MLLAALWLLVGQGALWRHWVWREAGKAVEETAAALGGEVRSRWTGYRVEAPGVRVDWSGGLRGARTRVRVASKVEVRAGLLGSGDVETVIASLR